MIKEKNLFKRRTPFGGGVVFMQILKDQVEAS